MMSFQVATVVELLDNALDKVMPKFANPSNKSLIQS
jgi:hypothetical protein